jgi:hypothetical protein
MFHVKRLDVRHLTPPHRAPHILSLGSPLRSISRPITNAVVGHPLRTGMPENPRSHAQPSMAMRLETIRAFRRLDVFCFFGEVVLTGFP